MYFFLKDDFDALLEEIQNIRAKLEDIGQEIGASCDQSSETFHDNYGFEEGERQRRLWNKRLSELNHIKDNAEIIIPDNNDQAGIGSTVTFKEIETNAVQTLRISSYINPRSSPNVISYASELGKLLLGVKHSDTVQGTISGRKRVFYIISIT